MNKVITAYFCFRFSGVIPGDRSSLLQRDRHKDHIPSDHRSGVRGHLGHSGRGCPFGVTHGPESPTVTGKKTEHSRETTRGKMEVRSGYFNGARVGWARVTGGNPANIIVMKVDLNGDKKPDVSCGPSGLLDGTSYLYEASPSPKRAFKACVKLGSDYTGPCHLDHQTGWW
jgi:hypothetical protein